MRSSYSGTRRIAAVGAALAFALGTGALGTAAASEGAAAVECAKGYLCLLPLFGNGDPVLVPEGEKAGFNPALAVTEVTNSTGVTYCVSGNLSYGLGPGQTQSGIYQVTVVEPSTSGFCPT
ncbi:hypothetical protein ACFWFF_37225 [Streptomyces sp. NPDC060223]|uniref:hypothetical protein n=1 Tax=unclassified Streptomyces TaxID=2593676 RepID=UPI003642724B